MTYDLMHFLHVVGALGMAAAFAIETAGLIGLRQATLAEEARSWMRTRRWLTTLGPGSMGLVLVTGLYAIVVTWGWQGWLVASLLGLVGLLIIGGTMTGVPMVRLEQELHGVAGTLTQSTRHHLQNPVMVISMSSRVSLTLGITFLMVQKPTMPVSSLALIISLLLGVAVGAALAPPGRYSPTEV